MTTTPDNFIADGIPVPTEIAVWPFKANHQMSTQFPAWRTNSMKEAVQYAWDSLVAGDAFLVSIVNVVEGKEAETLCTIGKDGMVMAGDDDEDVCHISRWLSPDAIKLVMFRADGTNTTTGGTEAWILDMIARSLEDLTVGHIEVTMPDGKRFQASRAVDRSKPVTLGGMLRDDVARRVCGCVRLLGSKYVGHTDDSLLSTEHPFDLTHLDSDDWDNLELDLASEFNHDFGSLEGQCANITALVDLVYQITA